MVMTTLLYVIVIFVLSSSLCIRFSDVAGYACVESGEVGSSFYILMSFISIIPSFFVTKTGKAPSDFFLQVIYLIHVIPSIVLMPLYIGSTFQIEQFIWGMFISISFSFILIVSRRLQIIKLRSLKIKNQYVVLFLLGSAMLFVGFIINDHGFTLTIPSIFDVYELRSVYKENSGFFSAYAVIIGGYFISPFLLLLSIKRGIRLLSVIMASLGLFLVFVIFTSSGVKSIAFIPFVSVLLYFFLTRVKNVNFFLLIFSIGTILFGYLLKIFNFDDFLVHWCRRFFISSGMNTAKFFEYFYLNENTPSKDAPYQISQYYYGTAGSANTGFYGDAIGRFGMVGLFINIVLLIIMVWLIKSVSKNIDKNILCTLLFFTGYAACNSSLLTVIVSYGFILLIFFMYLLQKSSYLRG